MSGASDTIDSAKILANASKIILEINASTPDPDIYDNYYDIDMVGDDTECKSGRSFEEEELKGERGLLSRAGGRVGG